MQSMERETSTANRPDGPQQLGAARVPTCVERMRACPRGRWEEQGQMTVAAQAFAPFAPASCTPTPISGRKVECGQTAGISQNSVMAGKEFV
jgi:hypothetical protein